MSPADIQKGFADQVNAAPREQHLAVFRAFCNRLETQMEREILDALCDMYLAGGLMSAGVLSPAKAKDTVLVLIHGIRTRAIWQEKVRALLSKNKSIHVIPIGYGYFDALKFLGRKKWRTDPIERVARELRDIRKLNGDKTIVVIAHSFGTYIISELLRDAPDIVIDRLLMCGAVVSDSYRWDVLSAGHTNKSVINEVGTKDVWPIFARASSRGYGAAGAFGFKTARVTDRYFSYGHSDFFSEKHIEDYWRPFVETGAITASPWDADRPSPSATLTLLGSFDVAKWLAFLLLGGGFTWLVWRSLSI